MPDETAEFSRHAAGRVDKLTLTQAGGSTLDLFEQPA